MFTTHRLKTVFESGSDQERVAATQSFVTQINEQLPYMAARQFTGLTLKKREDDWFIVLRGTYRGEPEVCFAAGHNVEEALMELVHGLIFDLNRWKPDKFTTMRSDKTGK